jgi:hypothetical protein
MVFLNFEGVEGIDSKHSIPPAYTVKKVSEIPVPSRDVTTKLSLGGNNDVITELFLPRGNLVSDIPAGDGKLVNLFYGVCSLAVLYANPIPIWFLASRDCSNIPAQEST